MIWLWWVVLAILVLVSIKVVNEYERGVRFTLGRYTGLMGPGLRWVWPIVQSWERIDIRTTVVDVPQQDTMTRDNVSVVINAVLYYKVAKPDTAVLEVRNYQTAVSQLAQTTMRDVVGDMSLDELLSKRELISKKIQALVSKATAAWGLNVEAVELKDVELPESLVRLIAKEAEAEREKRAVIIKAEGEYSAADNLVKAARSLTSVKGGLHIRTLQTMNNLGNEKSITKIYALPSEWLPELVKQFKK